MDNESKPFNMEFTFDRDLRETPVNEEEMKAGVNDMIDQLEMVDEPRNKAKLLGEIGVYSRIIGDLEQSELFLKKAIDVHISLEHKTTVFINELRLAHTFQWQKKFQKANALFIELIRKLNSDLVYQPYKDFLYQHYGKCKFDEGEYEAAYSLFQVALKLRREKGDYSLVKSTEVSINRCKEILNLP